MSRRSDGCLPGVAMIFISYRITDSLDLVGRLDEDLSREFGRALVFRDMTRIQGGQDWPREIEQNARDRKVMLVVIGPTWQSAKFADGELAGIHRLSDPADWVRKEVTAALDAGNVVLPVFLNDTAMPSAAWLAHCNLDRLARQQGVKLRTKDYEPDLANLVAALRKVCPGLPRERAAPRDPGTPAAAPAGRSLPAPPDLYAVPDYTLTSTFIGRSTELDELDAWARSTNPVMVFEGIGGLGKSALTWQWVQTRATYALPDLAGRLWWGFYEQDASVMTFVHHALAYVTGRDPDTLAKETSHYQRCGELLAELRRRPFLLVLDGFERILTAYHRWDKAQQRDDQIDPKLRACDDTRDGELLRQLVQCGPSKILLSTRLFPSALEDRAGHRPAAGVAHHRLSGLSRADALTFYRHAGVKGDEVAMLAFAKEFGYHSLVLKVVCGEIGNYPKKPFDFDAWRADPVYGDRLRLSGLDLKERYNHILRFALDGLDEPTRTLLCRIAVLSENVAYDTLAVLNPYLPPRPAEVEEPDNPETSDGWARLGEAEKRRRLAAYREARDAFDRSRAAVRAYPESAEYRDAIRAFDRALLELQDRGLLQWDRSVGRYDLHPVVRGHAAELLEAGDRTRTFLTVRDHFAGLPPDDLEGATELSHVSHSLEIYRCLVGASRLDQAIGFYRGDLADSLVFRIGAYTLAEELVRPLFRGGRDGLPVLSRTRDQSYVLNHLAVAVSEQGRADESMEFLSTALRIDLDAADWTNLATGLRNLSVNCGHLNRRAEGTTLLALARDVAEAKGDNVGVSMAILFQATDAIYEGRFADGEQLLDDFHTRPRPYMSVYQPGDAEYWRCVSQFDQGALTEAACQRGYDVAAQHRNVVRQYQFLALRAEWLLTRDQPAPALDAVDEALKITNRIGRPWPEYHDLRAWALARLGRLADARAELTVGEGRRFAAEAWRVLGDREPFRTCALAAYRGAWADGPPHIRWYDLERSRALLTELGEPEPQLPPFDPAKVKPIPYEAEIRAAIEPALRALHTKLVRGTDSTGRAGWCFLLLNRGQRRDFEQAARTGPVRLTDFGRVLESGYGADPPADVQKRMTDEFGFKASAPGAVMRGSRVEGEWRSR